MGAKALLAITHGEVGLWFELPFVISLLATLEKDVKVGGTPHFSSSHAN